jgi:threonine aldolase
MNFASDTWAGAAPQIVAALERHSAGFAAAYGASELDAAVERRFSEIFDRDVAVLFVPTGTAANALAIACAMKPGGIAIVHRGAHIVEDECGAPEFLSGGRIEWVDGAGGKIDPAALAGHLKRYDPAFLHHGRAVALSLTQATEAGTVYSLAEIRAIASQAHRLGMNVHMDGARFANALVALGASPAEMTWQCGVDLLSFGATKNGCWCAEALVIFDPAMRETAEYLRKRSGFLFSKSRFVAAQFEAYLDNGLWLGLARHANGMADRLRAAIGSAKRARLAWPSQVNEVFFVASRATEAALQKAGARFHEWHPPHEIADKLRNDEAVFRLVASFSTNEKEVDSFAALVS